MATNPCSGFYKPSDFRGCDRRVIPPMGKDWLPALKDWCEKRSKYKILIDIDRYGLEFSAWDNHYTDFKGSFIIFYSIDASALGDRLSTSQWLRYQEYAIENKTQELISWFTSNYETVRRYFDTRDIK